VQHGRAALSLEAQAREESINDFVKTMSKYNHHLDLQVTNFADRRAFGNIQWHKTKAEQLISFRSQISDHVKINTTFLLAPQV
jgi:hypothetical protein